MVIKSFQINMMKKLTFILLFVSTSFAQSKAYEFFNSFADIAEEVNESVVTITTTNTEGGYHNFFSILIPAHHRVFQQSLLY